MGGVVVWASPAEHQELDKLAQQRGLLLSVFHNRRWDSDFLTLKKLVAAGSLGEVVHFESHFDRYRPEVRNRWREQATAGSGIWYDLGPHLIDQALSLFGPPASITVDMAQLRTGAQATDYFHAVLSYPERRVVLHGTLLAAAESARYIVHGTQGSYIKYGLDPQEDRLKAGERLPQANWGQDTRDGVLTLAKGDGLESFKQPTEPGNYPAYYAGIRDALNGRAENPVTAKDAIAVMELIEAGIASAQQHVTINIV